MRNSLLHNVWYRIFHLGFGGAIHDSYNSEVFPKPCRERFVSMVRATEVLQERLEDGRAPKHLTYLILPTFVFEEDEEEDTIE